MKRIILFFTIICSLAISQACGQKTANERRNHEKQRAQETVTAGEYVDLGLPSGTLWASRNVGATKPEDYGDYFAWGETKGYKSGKRNFTWSTYMWGDFDFDVDYSADGTGELDLKIDAAYVNLGSQWRMPSEDQFIELKNKCTWTWTTYKGVKGYIVKGKNGNSIFLPAAGLRDGTSLYNAGSCGYYWLRTYRPEVGGTPDFGNYEAFDSDGFFCISGESSFSGGQSVRPVRINKKRDNPERAKINKVLKKIKK